VHLRNTGARAGAQVVQVYVGFPSSTGEPPRQLKAFDKIFLRPGESGTVKLDLNSSSFQTFDEASNSWVTTTGTYTVYVGTSSRDLPLQSLITIA
jgi:beta-glucosidase